MECDKTILMKTKTCMFNSNVKLLLSYGCETWEVAAHITNKLQKFVNRSLRRIMSIIWSDIISNTELWEAAREGPIILQIMMTKWQGSVMLWGRGMNLLKIMHWIGIYREPGEANLKKKTVLEEARKCYKTWSELRCWWGTEWDGDASQMPCFSNGTKEMCDYYYEVMKWILNKWMTNVVRV